MCLVNTRPASSWPVAGLLLPCLDCTAEQFGCCPTCPPPMRFISLHASFRQPPHLISPFLLIHHGPSGRWEQPGVDRGNHRDDADGEVGK